MIQAAIAKAAANVRLEHALPQTPVLHHVLLQLHLLSLMIAHVKVMEIAYPDTVQQLQICVLTLARLLKELDPMMMDVTVPPPPIV